MKTVYFIRHGMTEGNREKRYIGRTDEPLCEEGKAQAAALKTAGLPVFGHIFISPYLRCHETAAILFPEMKFTAMRELRECDFGLFEGKTAAELSESEEYGAWLETGCTGPIPGGESVEGFKTRCHLAFLQAMETVPENGSAAFVIHGGCIMAILEACAMPRRPFYEYHLRNCGFVRCVLAGSTLTVVGASIC